MCSSVKKKSKGLWVSILYLSPFFSNKTIFDIVLMEVIFYWIYKLVIGHILYLYKIILNTCYLNYHQN